MNARRLLVALAIGLFATLLVCLRAVSADDGERPSDQPAVLLQPGNNLVGWIQETMAVGALFEAIPQIEAIFSWDAKNAQWRVAAPAVPEHLWTLPEIEPGMAVWVRNGSDEAVPWVEQSVPVRGLVELHQGTNWVSWAGPDDWSVEQVARGIGISLVELRLDDARFVAAQPETADQFPQIRRGDALVVTTTRGINWLQPTGLMPNLVFPPDASEELKQDIREDVRAVIDYFADRFGIQADRITVETFGHPHARGDTIAVHMDGRHRSQKRSVLVHEYFHAVQYQLMGRGWAYRTQPRWLTEGTATWAQFEPNGHPGKGSHTGLDIETSSVWDLIYVALQPPARDLGPSPLMRGSAQDYLVGEFAVTLLVHLSHEDSPIEYYRLLGARSIDVPPDPLPHPKNLPNPFEVAFGLSETDFYQEYDRWRIQMLTDYPDTASEYADRLADYHWEETTILGQVLREDGSPVAGAWIWPSIKGSMQPVGSETDESGKFNIELRGVVEGMVLYVTLDNEHSCGGWYKNGTIVWDWYEYDVAVGGDLRGRLPIEAYTEQDGRFTIVLTDDFCRRFLGRVVDDEERPLAGVEVAIRPYRSRSGLSFDQGRAIAWTDRDGKFDVLVPTSGSYVAWVSQWRQKGPEWSRCLVKSGEIAIGEGTPGELLVVVPQCRVWQSVP